MKKYLLVSLLALGALTSCQQDQTVEEMADSSFTFNALVDGSTTRSSSQKLDVISLCANTEKTFTIFDLQKDTRSWNNFTNKNVKFYAHFPKLANDESVDAERIISGGNNYLFGDADVKKGTNSVTLKFKSANAQILVKLLNEDGTYADIKSVKLKLKNKGKQNLKTGVITAIESIASELVTFTKNEDGTVSGNIIPQEIPAGTVLVAETASGEQQTATMTRSMSLSANNIYQIVVDKGKVEDSVIDPVIPL